MKKKTLGVLFLAVLLSCTACTPTTPIGTDSNQSEASPTQLVIQDTVSQLTAKAEQQHEIVDRCDTEIMSSTKENDLTIVNFKVTMDITLNASPDEVPMLIGMQRAIDELIDPAQIESAKQYYDGFYIEWEGLYGTQEKDVTTYLRAEIKNAQDYTVYYVDSANGEELLLEDYWKTFISDEDAMQKGYDAVYKHLENVN